MRRHSSAKPKNSSPRSDGDDWPRTRTAAGSVALLVFGRSWLAVIRAVMVNDEPRTSLTGDEQPDPLKADADLKAPLCQEFQVNYGPHEPCNRSTDAQAATLQHGKAFADHGHVALVEVAE